MRFQRFAAVSAILVTIFTLGNVVTLFSAVKNDTRLFSDAALLLPLGAASARMFHISMVFDALAYLAFVPVVVFCWAWLRPRGEAAVALYTVSGLAYSLLGSLGAVVLDAVLPGLMGEYAATSVASQGGLRLLGRYVYRAVAHGIWNPLEVLMVSVWFLGVGLLIVRERRGLGMLALVIATFGLLDPIGWALGSDLVMNIGGAGTALILAWAAWFGIDLLRRPALVAD